MKERQRKLYAYKINILGLNYISVKQTEKQTVFDVCHIKFTLTMKEKVSFILFLNIFK